MQDAIQKNWKIIVIFILAMAVTVLVSRGWESKYVEQLVAANQTLGARLQQTEQLLKGLSWDERSTQIWRQLGYDVPIPKKPIVPEK